MIYQKTIINETVAYKFEYQRKDSPCNFISTLIESNKKTFHISATSYDMTEEFKSRYNQILTTFIFVE